MYGLFGVSVHATHAGGGELGGGLGEGGEGGEMHSGRRATRPAKSLQSTRPWQTKLLSEAGAVEKEALENLKA